MERRRTVLTLALLLAALAAAAFYYAIDPSATPLPRCPFNVATGLLCPGCGSQRAFHALLHGDLAAAWHLNAMMTVLLPLIPLYLIAEWHPARLPRLHRLLTHPVTVSSIAVGIVLWWVGRNIWHMAA